MKSNVGASTGSPTSNRWKCSESMLTQFVLTSAWDKKLFSDLDALICSASFEDRCLTVPNKFSYLASSVRSVIVAWNVNYLSAVGENRQRLLDMFPHSVNCELDADDPLVTADRFMQCLRDVFGDGNTPKRIGIDITAFTKESLLILLRCLLKVMKREDSVIGLYNRASSYEGVEKKDRWLSRGVREIRSVLGYPGNFRPTRRTHLVLLAGFEDDRALRLTAELEPSVLSLGTPDPKKGHAHEHNTTMQSRKARWLSHLGSEVREFYFDGYSLDKCVESIRLAVGQESSMNTILAPMNTKISTVATGIFALGNPDVQITYAQADVYNYDRYSSPADEVYVFDLSTTLVRLINET